MLNLSKSNYLSKQLENQTFKGSNLNEEYFSKEDLNHDYNSNFNKISNFNSDLEKTLELLKMQGNNINENNIIKNSNIKGTFSNSSLHVVYQNILRKVSFCSLSDVP